MRIVVTGAASPLGRAVVSLLLQQGHHVTGVVRRVGGVQQMKQLGAEAVQGDVRRPEVVARAFAGAQLVHHLAGFFDFWEPERGVYDSVNVGATRTVLHAALAARVPRLVVGSSAITHGDAGGTGLARSRAEAERLAQAGRMRGTEIVVVKPGIVVAPGDAGWMGRLLRRAVSGRRPLTADASLGWIWVDDAARGLVRAGAVGVDGARYVLSGERLSSRRFVAKVASCVGAPAPRAFPRALTLAEGALESAVSRATRRRPALALDEARFLVAGFEADGREAADELGIAYTPSARYLPGLARDYARALERFGRG